MILLNGIVSGIVATLFFDIFQIALSFSYGIKKSNWALIGRYFIGTSRMEFIQKDIVNEPEEKNELLIGYLIHYIIGAIFGIVYTIINFIYFDSPSFYLALTIGLITVLFGWCIIMPFAFNIGFFAQKMEDQKKILVQNLLAHYFFGTGLFFGLLIVN